MSRPERKLQKRFVVFCEGDTEYNYIDNKKGTIPHFLIVNNPDFEYVACLHVPEYKGQEVTRFLQTVLGFQSLEQFKKIRKCMSA